MSQLADSIEYALRDSTITPPSISANQDNYAPTGWSEASVVRASTTALRSINSALANVVRKTKLIVNVDVNVLQLPHNRSGATTGNYALDCPSGIDFLLGPGDSCFIFADDVTQRWKVVGIGSAANRLWTGTHGWQGACEFAQPLTIDSTLLLNSSVGEVLYSPSRSRLKQLHTFMHVDATALALSYSIPLGYFASSAAGAAIFPIDLPTGAVMHDVAFAVQAPSGSVQINVHKSTITAGDGTVVHQQLGSTFTTSGTAMNVSTIGDFSAETIDANGSDAGSFYRYYVGVNFSAGGQTLRYLRVYFSDPGPRNY